MSPNVPSTTSLGDSIAAFTANMAKHAPAGVVATLGAELRKLADSGIAALALRVGAKAADFSLARYQRKGRHPVGSARARSGWWSRSIAEAGAPSAICSSARTRAC